MTHTCLYGFLIVSLSFPLTDLDGSSGAGRKAIAKSVAVVVSYKLRLASHHRYCTFVAGSCTCTASIALLFVYVDNLSDHSRILLVDSLAAIWKIVCCKCNWSAR